MNKWLIFIYKILFSSWGKHPLINLIKKSIHWLRHKLFLSNTLFEKGKDTKTSYKWIIWNRQYVMYLIKLKLVEPMDDVQGGGRYSNFQSCAQVRHWFSNFLLYKGVGKAILICNPQLTNSLWAISDLSTI